MKKYATLYCTCLVFLMACKKHDHAPVKGPAPVITSFMPANGYAGYTVVITGDNFDTVASHVKVSFNGAPAVVKSVNNPYIEAIVPAGATTGPITVTVSGQSVTSAANFVILPGKWEEKGDIQTAHNSRSNFIAFSINGKGYFGLGQGKEQVMLDDLWEYDPATNKWTQKASLGLGMEMPFCMVINNKAYVGAGIIQAPPNYSTKVFEYDPVADKWTRKADIPGDFRTQAFGIGYNGKGYAGFGDIIPGGDYTKSKFANDWYEYDPAADKWTQKADAPQALTRPTGAALNGKIYAGTNDLNVSLTKYWSEYDPVADTWVSKSFFPGEVYNLNAIVVKGKAYLMGAAQCWEFTAGDDSWQQKAFFSDKVGGIPFAIGDNAYFVGNYIDTDILQLWQFDPNK